MTTDPFLKTEGQSLQIARPSWRDGLTGILVRPEAVTVLIFLLAFAVSTQLSRYFLDATFLLDQTSLYVEIGVMALAMTFVIISGNIDLSVASGLALVGVVGAVLHQRFGMAMELVIPLQLLLGTLLGLVNGLLVTWVGLPSLTATLGTFALYRGLAQILLGDRSVTRFPDWYLGVDFRSVAGLPLPLTLFLILAVIAGLLLHKTVFGRCVQAIGTNEPAARFSGVNVKRVKLGVFCLSGLMMGLGATLMVSRLGAARYDLALGNELTVITAVVLGGTSIFGGRGSIFGTVVALMVLAVLSTGMNVRNITADKQLVVTGTLLVISVLLTNLTTRLRGGRRD